MSHLAPPPGCFSASYFSVPQPWFNSCFPPSSRALFLVEPGGLKQQRRRSQLRRAPGQGWLVGRMMTTEALIFELSRESETLIKLLCSESLQRRYVATVKMELKWVLGFFLALIL